MVMTRDARDKLGYTRHPADRDGSCFYCDQPVDRDYFDYVPPRDVKNDPELSALVNVPFVYVTACHPCKTKLYPVRYTLKTPEERRMRIQARMVKNGPNRELIKAQLMHRNPRSWEMTMFDAKGHPMIVDRPDYELSEEAALQKAAWLAQQPGAEAEGLPVSGPSSDVQGAMDDAKDVLGF